MTEIKNTTKAGQAILSDYNRPTAARTIYEAYGRPSAAKVRAYEDIARRAADTPGYNHDLKVCGAGSHFFSTVYSYTEDGTTYVIKDTPSNTYKVAM